MSLREHSKTLFFRALFVTKCVSIVVERKQSFRFSFSKVCIYFRCGAVFDIFKVIFREKTLKRKQKQTKKGFKNNKKLNNELKNNRLAWCENPRQDNNDGFAAYGQGEKG